MCRVPSAHFQTSLPSLAPPRGWPLRPTVAHLDFSIFENAASVRSRKGRPIVLFLDLHERVDDDAECGEVEEVFGGHLSVCATFGRTLPGTHTQWRCHTNSNWPCAIWGSQLGLRQR
jgi:hypothetical protein